MQLLSRPITWGLLGVLAGYYLMTPAVLVLALIAVAVITYVIINPGQKSMGAFMAEILLALPIFVVASLVTAAIANDWWGAISISWLLRKL